MVNVSVSYKCASKRQFHKGAIALVLLVMNLHDKLNPMQNLYRDFPPNANFLSCGFLLKRLDFVNKILLKGICDRILS